jgi:Fe2+ transport system protein FeoA
MASVFIARVNKMGTSEVVLVTKIAKGLLKDTMKTVIDGKPVSIKRMMSKSIDVGAGPRGASVMHPTPLKEAKEGQVVEMMISGADYQTMAKLATKTIEFQ